MIKSRIESALEGSVIWRQSENKNQFSADARMWFFELCNQCGVPYADRDILFGYALAHKLGHTIGEVHSFMTGGQWRGIYLGKSISLKSSAESSTPLLASGTSSKNFETEWTFTASWPANSTDITSTRIAQLKEELESNLNLAAAMVPADRRSLEQLGPERTVRLSISQTNKGWQRAISIEEHTSK